MKLFLSTILIAFSISNLYAQTELSFNEAQEIILNKEVDKLVVIEYYKPSNSDCEKMKPIIKTLINEFPNTDFFKLNIKKHNIHHQKGIPSYDLIFKGVVRETIIGTVTLEEFSNIIKEHEISKIKEYYNNGQLMLSGLKIGKRKFELWKYFYENGQLEKSGHYEKDKEMGVWNYYYQNGQLMETGEYGYKGKTGEWKMYFKNGQIADITNYKYDVEYGRHISYYTTGKVQREVSYSDGKEIGEEKSYNRDGSLYQTGNWDVGKKNGIWSTYFINGQLYTEKLWKNGKLMEILKYYDISGNSLDKGTLKNGNGNYNEYDNKGSIIRTIEVVNGEIQE